MIDLTMWDVTNILSKFLIYIGIATAVGGPFIATLIKPSINKKALNNYIFSGSILGVSAVIINFFIQVGAFSEAGAFGMFDTDMVVFLWQSAIGDSVLWRLFAFIALGSALFFGSLNVRYEAFNFKHSIFIFFYVIAIFCFAYSFTFVGHSADIGDYMGGITKWLISFHIITMTWWIGALYPLWLSCKLLQSSALYKLMTLFGQIAMCMVGLLIICGIGLLLLFFETPLELFTTLYGQAMLLKLMLVSVILLIAAYHKYHLVEEVQEKESSHKLQKSITNEMILAIMILGITAVLSSVLGPVNLV